MQQVSPEKNTIFTKIMLWVFLLCFLALSIINTDFIQKKFFYPLLYEREIKEYAARNKLPSPLVAAVIKNESHFVASAVSKSGAVGLMQIMPETGGWIAKEMGMKDFDEKLLGEPTANIRLGCWYLNELNHEFANEQTVMAAYNAGRGQVKKWLEDKEWDGEDPAKIPFQETRKYVQNVLEDKKTYEKLYQNVW